MAAIISFKTAENPVTEVVYREKGSKFLGYLFPASSEEEAREFLKNLKEDHPKASHFCYAFRLGSGGENYRANDDGEPSGSAGLPIYNQLVSTEITNVLLVVIRYFGGTKLGVSGLVKAYKETAKLTLSQAKIILEEPEEILKITFPYEKQNLIFSALHRFSAKILHFQLGAICTLEVSAKSKIISDIILQLNEIPFLKIS